MKIYRWTSPFNILPLFAALLLGVGLLIFPTQVIAQSSSDGPPTLVTHLRGELQAKDAMRRQLALVDINALSLCSASCTITLRSIQDKNIGIENETGVGSVVDLEALVPDLLKSYRKGPTDGHRLLAMHALLLIGNEKSLEQLIDEGASQSAKVERATQAGLASFYLKKYPELSEQTLRTMRLSVDDVTQAKALRVKKAKITAKKAKKDKN